MSCKHRAGRGYVLKFSVASGQQFTATISETAETDDDRPLIRIWTPAGAVLGSSSGLASATIGPDIAPVTGTYLVLVSSFDSGFNGAGSHSLLVKLTP